MPETPEYRTDQPPAEQYYHNNPFFIDWFVYFLKLVRFIIYAFQKFLLRLRQLSDEDMNRWHYN